MKVRKFKLDINTGIRAADDEESRVLLSDRFGFEVESPLFGPGWTIGAVGGVIAWKSREARDFALSGYLEKLEKAEARA